MKKLLILVALISLAAVPSVAQTGPYLVDYFSNNSGPGGAADQQVRLVNFGLNGTPLTSPTGDVCVNIYVFDANQEMVECCSCKITPNGLRTISVANNLTNNPLTSVVSATGAIKMISVPGGTCNATKPIADANLPVDSIVGFGTHLQTSGGTAAGTFITETNIPWAPLSAVEAQFLPQACLFVRYLGSNKGVCTCGTGS